MQALLPEHYGYAYQLSTTTRPEAGLLHPQHFTMETIRPHMLRQRPERLPARSLLT